MRKCSEKCKELNVSCPVNDCRHWINYEKDMNCLLITTETYGPLTLKEISARLSISHVRVKQIEDKLLRKLQKRISVKELKALAMAPSL